MLGYLNFEESSLKLTQDFNKGSGSIIWELQIIVAYCFAVIIPFKQKTGFMVIKSETVCFCRRSLLHENVFKNSDVSKVLFALQIN